LKELEDQEHEYNNIMQESAPLDNEIKTLQKDLKEILIKRAKDEDEYDKVCEELNKED
jgi:peptidoglycan hydrolase CwlO-like protein